MSQLLFTFFAVLTISKVKLIWISFYDKITWLAILGIICNGFSYDKITWLAILGIICNGFSCAKITWLAILGIICNGFNYVKITWLAILEIICNGLWLTRNFRNIIIKRKYRTVQCITICVCCELVIKIIMHEAIYRDVSRYEHI